MHKPDPVRVAVKAGELIRMSAPRTTRNARPGRNDGGQGSSAGSRPYVLAKEFSPMGIFSRTRDIIAANVTDLRQIGKLDRLQEGWVEKAELAISKNREDLAKAALFERQKAADMADQLKAEIEVLDDALRASEADIAKLQGKLREARARQNAIMTRMEKVDDAFSRFDVLERHADLAEGHADSLAIGGPRTLDDEIAELRSSDKVDAELEALKASMARRTNGGAADKQEG
jgi:phage shock protein A